MEGKGLNGGTRAQLQEQEVCGTTGFNVDVLNAGKQCLLPENRLEAFQEGINCLLELIFLRIGYSLVL